MGDIFDDENEPTMTMKEYIEGVEAQELEADLVLGGDEGKDCTYSKGYLKRQAVFSCLTCVPAGNAGVCTACGLSCHDGHEVVELWTRRRFRCDCGNSKFGSNHCKLLADKDPENKDNTYNQNYKGLYCSCHRPYPDPDEEDQVGMIQCCICEDWFHENHLGLEPTEQIPRDEEGEPVYEDFVCQGCALRCSFLSLYQEMSLTPSALGGATANSELQNQSSQTENYDGNAQNETSEKNVTCGKIFAPAESVFSNGIHKDDSQLKQPNLNSQTAIYKDHVVQPSSLVLEVAKGIETSCVFKAGSSRVEDQNNSEQLTAKSSLPFVQVTKGMEDQEQELVCKVRTNMGTPSFPPKRQKSLFLAKNWRELLCRCSSCTDLYISKEVAFLLDKEDTLEEYEKIAKQRREEKLQQQERVELKFLQNLGHVQQIELLSGISDMQNELRSYLDNFDTTKAVTCADIHEFFQNLERKRQRLI
eukprot:Gb_07681 [translate_table: standard]